MGPKTKAIVQEVRKLISSGWVQCAQIRSATWLPLPPGHPNAVFFCLVGAIEQATVSSSNRVRCAVIKAVSMKLPEVVPARGVSSQLTNIMVWNDPPSRTKQEVIDLLDNVLSS